MRFRVLDYLPLDSINLGLTQIKDMQCVQLERLKQTIQLVASLHSARALCTHASSAVYISI